MFYVYDGSFEGFLSALTVVMRHHTDVSDSSRPFYGIIREKDEPILLHCQVVSIIPNIIPDFGHYIQNHFGEPMVKTIYHAFLSEAEGIENAITEYIFLARKQRRDPIDELYLDCVKKVARAAKTVIGEAHRYLGLLRFRKLKAPRDSVSSPVRVAPDRFNDSEESGSFSGENPLMALLESASALEGTFTAPEIFIAQCEPVTCSLPLIAEHFVERLPNQLFIIFDQRRKLCVIHLQGGQWTIEPYDPLLDDSAYFDTSFENLWQLYFKALAIPERINPLLQRSNMPKRYWKYLVEHPGK